jgi:hypothetical protein
VRKFSIFIAALLIVGHLSLEFGELLEHVFPRIADMRIDPFFDKSYVFPVAPGQPPGIPLKWWIYYVTNDFLWVLVMFALCIVSGQYSYRLFRVCAVFFIYHIADHFLMWYNYRSTHAVYWLMAVAYIAAVVMLFIPDRKTGRVVGME